MADRVPRPLSRLRRWWAADDRVPPLAGEPFLGSGLEGVVAVARAAGSILVAGAAVAGRSELAGATGGGLPAAVGLALGGVRTTLVVGGEELERALPLLAETVARRVPLVVVALGRAGWLGAAESGATVLVPADLQEAIDLAIAARLFAEDALATVVVGLDDAGLAAAIQNARLPAAAALAERFGSAADAVHATGAGEKTLFGVHRRRVPRWHDAGAARRLGGDSGTAAAAAEAAAELFFVRELPRRLDEVCAAVAAATGRELDAVAGRALSRAERGVVAAGPDALIAAATAERLHRDGARLTVLRVRRLAPFPIDVVAGLAHPDSPLAVLDRSARPGAPGALAALFTRTAAAAGLRAADSSLVFPSGDAACDPAELAGAFRGLAEGAAGRRVVGLVAESASSRGRDPRRAARLDALRRREPRLDAEASAREPGFDPRPEGAVTLRLERRRGEPTLVAGLARLLHGLVGGELRARASVAGALDIAVDRLTWCPGNAVDPGESEIAEIELVVRAAGRTVAAGATLIFIGDPAGPASFPLSLGRQVLAGDAELFTLDGSSATPELERARRLGALAGVVLRRARLEVPERRRRLACEAAVADAPAASRGERLAALIAGFDGLRHLALPVVTSELEQRPPLPLADCDGCGGEGELGDPNAFWELAGLPVAEGRREALAADPAIAVGALPATSSPRGSRSATVAEVVAARCTGCGDCWSLCPHAAIEARAATPQELVEDAMARAAHAGRSAEPLRRFLPKLVAGWSSAPGGRPEGDAFVTAGRTVLAGARLDDERRSLAETALAALADELRGPAWVSAPAFAGVGSLLALAVDPERCTGCELCVAACGTEAVTLSPRTPELERRGLEGATAVRRIPAPAGATLESLAAPAMLGPLAAALLDPVCARTLEGFDGAPAGDLARLAARQALALAAGRLKPRRTAIRARTAELAERLATAVREALSGALPESDLAALAAGLEGIDEGSVALPELAGRLAEVVAGGRIDVPRLRRLVEAARTVAELEAELAGDGGRAARSPLAVVVGGGEALAWARRWPDNPFGVPAVVAGDAPLGVARGLALAERERAVAEARGLRRARLELERPGEALASQALAGLRWEDLNEEERALATPVVALVDERTTPPLGDDALAILAGELPIAIVTLAPGPGVVPSPWAALAFATPAGVVAHATPLDVEPLDAAWALFAEGERGALIRLLAPRGAAVTGALTENLETIRGAVAARVFPLNCRDAAVHTNATVPRVDPIAEASDREVHHAAELAAAAARHREDLDRVERELRARLAEGARVRLLELVSRRRGREAS